MVDTIIDPARHAAELEDQGFTIIYNAIEPELVDRLVEAILRLEGSVPTTWKPGSGDDTTASTYFGKTLRMRNLLARDPSFAEIPAHKSILPVVQAILGQGCLLRAMSTLVVPPGEPAQAIHSDDAFGTLPFPRPHRPIMINTIWALTDFTAENGATRLIPGSHKLADFGEYHEDDPELLSAAERFGTADAIQAVMPKGSILVNHGSILHSASGNQSSERRYGMSVQYNEGWIRPVENYHLSLPLEILRSFPEPLQAILGVRGLYMDQVGTVNGLDPAVSLFGG